MRKTFIYDILKTRGDSCKNSYFFNKSLELEAMIMLFYNEYPKSKKDTTIPKQLLRSGTSVGANLNEAIYGTVKQILFQNYTFP